MSSHETSNPMADLLDRAERRMVALEARLARLEVADSGSAGGERTPVVAMEEVSSRRGLFKVVGAVASGAVAHTLLSASPAAASTAGPYVGLNVNENTTGLTGVRMTPGAGDSIAFQGTNLATAGTADGIKGVSDSVLGAGVAGSSNNGYGVFGSTASGYAVYSNGRLGLGEHLASPGAPVSGEYKIGDIVRDSVGNIYACVVTGSALPNALVPAAFRKIAGPATAGQLHLLPVPLRAYDSRPAAVQWAASGGDGPLAGSPSGGSERTVTLANGRSGTNPIAPAIPAGAVGVLMTLTLAETVNGGYVSIFSNAIAWPGTSTMNFSGSGQVIATTTVSAVDSLRQIRVRVGGPSTTATSFLIDLIGYYM